MKIIKNGYTPNRTPIQLADYTDQHAVRPHVVAIMLRVDERRGKRFTWSYPTPREAENTYNALLQGANPRTIRGMV